MHKLIPSVVLVSSLSACGLFGEEGPPATPTPTEVPVTAPDAGKAVELVVPEGGIGLVTFSDGAAGCAVDFAIVGGSTTALGAIPGACPAETWREASVARSKDGQLLVKTPAGAFVRGKDGVTTPVAPLPQGWALGDITWDAAGAVVAGAELTAVQAEVKPKGDASEYTWTVNGTQVAYTTEGYEADVVLCSVFTWKDGGWVQGALTPTGLAEGTSSPNCYAGVADAPAPLKSADGGGPGVEIAVAAVPGGADGEWHVEHGIAHKATEWLEGQNRMSPAWFAGTTPWKALPGFEGQSSLAIDSRPGFTVVCNAEHALVIDATTGDTKWSGVRCPIVWQ